MKIKTNEASDQVLDWLVADAEEISLDLHYALGGKPWSPSTDWSQGGPIIEREEIAVATDDEYGWQAYYDKQGMNDECSFGPTLLIAAMRCYAASKLGEEVDVPEEKLK